MTKEQYESLTDKERLLYKEMSDFAKRLSERFDEVVALLKQIVNVDER